ncbi:MAG: phosphatase PAP2 family protein [Candidatus Limnocylindria bacterium]
MQSDDQEDGMLGPMRHRLVIASLALLAVGPAPLARAEGFRGGVREALGERFEAAPVRDAAQRRGAPRLGSGAKDAILRWNQIAIDASGLDHTQPGPGDTHVFGQQIGPGRSSRALAIVQIAVFDAVNAITGGYQSYTRLSPAPAETDMGASIAQAAHDTLAALYPSQSASFDAALAEDLDQIPARKRREKENGIRLGRRAAAAILARREDDGSQHPEPRVGIDYLPSDEPGMWRQDPISQIPLALGAYWGGVKPFVLRSVEPFRAPVPPAIDSEAYAIAFDEVQRLGGDGVVTPTERSEDQTFAGIFWAYDGTPSLCAPPRLYNQITVQIAEQQRSLSAIELARLFALVNTAMADAGVVIWESKYFYGYWRPITGIREADEGTGPTGAGDGNPGTTGDPEFSPLGAPASNLIGPNFTPPFPAYPSGHAGFGGALFQTLRRFYGTDRIAFTFVSDEFNGVTLDNQGNVRPLIPRSFETLTEAEEENGQSRIYLGIHWSFDKTEGIAQGRRVADAVFRSAFAPVRRGGSR